MSSTDGNAFFADEENVFHGRGKEQAGNQRDKTSATVSSRELHGFSVDLNSSHTRMTIDGCQTQWLLVVIAILSSMFTYSLDGTIVADLVPSIVNDFESVPLLPWLSVG